MFPPRVILMAVIAATHFCHQSNVESVLKHSGTDELMLFLCLIRAIKAIQTFLVLSLQGVEIIILLLCFCTNYMGFAHQDYHGLKV